MCPDSLANKIINSSIIEPYKNLIRVAPEKKLFSGGSCMSSHILRLGLPIEDRRWPTNKYKNYTNLATKNIEDFWDKEARHLDWYKSWDKVLEWNNPFAKWFVGGKINACYNAVDRHIKTQKKTKAAILAFNSKINSQAAHAVPPVASKSS